MSSRNIRLSQTERQKALLISKALFDLKNKLQIMTIALVKSWVKSMFDSNEIYKFEYFEIVDSESLNEVNDINDSNNKIACIAVFVGDVRLIDNITI